MWLCLQALGAEAVILYTSQDVVAEVQAITGILVFTTCLNSTVCPAAPLGAPGVLMLCIGDVRHVSIEELDGLCCVFEHRAHQTIGW